MAVFNTPFPVFAPRGRLRRAFSLIELLTVIAIIAILSAILIPSTQSVMVTARKAETAARLRACYMGVMQFAQANGDAIPLSYSTSKDGYGRTRGTWMNQLYYNSGDFIGVAKNKVGVADPDSIKNTEIFGCRQQLSMHNVTDTQVSFGFNSRIGNWPDNGPSPIGAKRTADVVNPTKTVLIMHGVYREAASSPFTNNVNETYRNVARAVYGENVMGVFFDGHVDELVLREVPDNLETEAGKYFWLGCDAVQ